MLCANAEAGSTNASAEIAVLNQTVTEVFKAHPWASDQSRCCKIVLAARALIGLAKPQLRSYCLAALRRIPLADAVLQLIGYREFPCVCDSSTAPENVHYVCSSAIPRKLGAALLPAFVTQVRWLQGVN